MRIKIIIIAICIIAAGAGWFFLQTYFLLKAPVVTDFDSCAKAGYPVMESYPRQCRAKDGRLFVEDIIKAGQGCQNDLSCPLGQWCNQGICQTRVPTTPKPQPTNPSLCQNLCGDKICQEVVCLGENCPCAETAALCPQDCATK